MLSFKVKMFSDSKNTGWIQRGKFTDKADAVHDVSSKTGYTFCNNEVNLSRPAVCDHLIKFGSVLQGRAADAFIRVDADECPIGMPLDLIFVVVLLQLI